MPALLQRSFGGGFPSPHYWLTHSPSRATKPFDSPMTSIPLAVLGVALLQTPAAPRNPLFQLANSSQSIVVPATLSSAPGELLSSVIDPAAACRLRPPQRAKPTPPLEERSAAERRCCSRRRLVIPRVLQEAWRLMDQSNVNHKIALICLFVLMAELKTLVTSREKLKGAKAT